MGENNGNVTTQEVVEQVLEQTPEQQEIAQLKEALNRMYQENMKLSETWVLHRANFLFQVVKNEFFNKEFKERAAKELESYLYPPQTQEEVKEA